MLQNCRVQAASCAAPGRAAQDCSRPRNLNDPTSTPLPTAAALQRRDLPSSPRCRGAQLSTPANDLVIDCKLRNASSLYPLREEVAQVFHGYLRRQLFEIIDRSVLTTILLEKGMQ